MGGVNSVNEAEVSKAFMIKIFCSEDASKISPHQIMKSLFSKVVMQIPRNINVARYRNQQRSKMKPFFLKSDLKLPSKLLLLYLCAISFHNNGPSSTSTSDISHKTINWNNS